MAVVFIKTPKGQEEITAKTGGLTARNRRVLIFIDGQRTVDDLGEMLPASDLQNTLSLLEEAGFIEVMGSASRAGKTQAATVEGIPSGTTFRPAPDPVNGKELEMAKNFIQNSLKTFCGPYAHLEIVEAAYAAKTHGQMREQFDPWYQAVVQTSQGKQRAEELRSQLLKVI